MQKKAACLALLAVRGLLASPGSGLLAAEDLVPPLSGNPPLTSSFGEFRSGHYHGGLDYSTGGGGAQVEIETFSGRIELKQD